MTAIKSCFAALAIAVLILAADTPIEYVAMSCFWHSLIGVDKNGEAVTPVLTWADTRAKDRVKDLRGSLDEGDLAAHRTVVLAPIAARRVGHSLTVQPPVSQASLALMALGAIERAARMHQFPAFRARRFAGLHRG